jgi:hypothetical protein
VAGISGSSIPTDLVKMVAATAAVTMIKNAAIEKKAQAAFRCHQRGGGGGAFGGMAG